MKPLPLFLAVCFVSLLFAFILPHLSRSFSTRPEAAQASLSASAISLAETGSFAPESGTPAVDRSIDNSIAAYPGLTDFAAILINGRADEIVGVYAPGVFALRVEQQPAGQPEYVNSEANLVTQFALPKQYGSVGLLAHNFLSGSAFFKLQPGQDVVLIYGDGRYVPFRVSGSLTFQALNPNSPFSQFVDLAAPGRQPLSSAELFERVYTTGNTLVFQTCIEAQGEPSWGRIFITAELAEPLQLGVPTLTPLTSVN